MRPAKRFAGGGRNSEMTFDPSITLGAILNAFVLLVGFVGAFVRIGGRIDLLALRIKGVEETLKDSRDFEKRLVINEERITNHGRSITTVQQDISDLRRGEGFITSHRKGVDGEYP
jgi:hypothetical protein